MAHGEVIWADLSTFDVPTAKAFYGSALGWKFSDAGEYHVARAASGDIAGIYKMPHKFVAIRMPSFWMSYFEVESADKAAEAATRLGGKLEVGPEDQAGLGRFALIRDPLGAVFLAAWVIAGHLRAPCRFRSLGTDVMSQFFDSQPRDTFRKVLP